MIADQVKIYVCFEPDAAICAERLNSWTHTNPDVDSYNSRLAIPVDDREAEPIKATLRERIKQADVTV